MTNIKVATIEAAKNALASISFICSKYYPERSSRKAHAYMYLKMVSRLLVIASVIPNKKEVSRLMIFFSLVMIS